jgi:branched-chain amino acid transport system ATP-binding protein
MTAAPAETPVHTEPAAMLVADGLTRRFGGLLALDNVSLTAQAGHITAIVGPNGAGKSTLLHCITGSLRPDSGRVLLDGRDVTKLPPDARARRGLVPTFQQGSAFASLTVRENILIGAENQRRDSLWHALVGRSVPGAQQKAEDILKRLDLMPWADSLAGDVPTGTIRLIEIGRAFAVGPRVLLLDEPLSGLGTAEARHALDLFTELAAAGLAVVMIEHDPRVVAKFADMVWVIDEGRVAASGPFGPDILAAWTA